MKRNKHFYSAAQCSTLCQKLINEKTIILDTETTGLHAEAEVIELTLLDVSGNILFNSLIKPRDKISEDVIAIHGITNEMVANSPTFDEVAQVIAQHLENANLVAHNAHYDRLRLEFEFSRLEIPTLPTVKSWACTMLLNLRTEDQRFPKLSALAKMYDIEYGGQAHRAYTDADVCRRILLAMASEATALSLPQMNTPLAKKKANLFMPLSLCTLLILSAAMYFVFN